MRQAKSVEHVGDGGERLHDNAAGVQGVAHLLERDPSLAQHDGPQVVRVLLQQGTPVAANLGRDQAAGLAHPLHQLDGRRGAYGEAAGGLPDRTTTFNGLHDPLTEILGQGRGHDQLHRSRPRPPPIRTPDSVQARTALARPTAATRSARSSGRRARISTWRPLRNVSTTEYSAASDTTRNLLTIRMD